MTVVVVSRPVVRTAPYWVSTEEIAGDLRERHPAHPRLALWLRMLGHTGVRTRPWVAPLAEAGADRGVGERSRAAYEGARPLAVDAALEALRGAGVAPGEVDCLVTTHTTSWTVPGLDVDLIRLLGLRPDVSRVGLATVACAGGAHALVQAARFVRGHPGARVLVVAAEALSTLYHPRTLSLQTVLYGGLFGDAGGAVVVRDADAGADAGADSGAGRPVPDGLLEVTGTWEFVLPDSQDAYWGVIDRDGLFFDSGPDAKKAAGRVLPYLTEWLDGHPVGWAAVHPGGPGIVRGTLTGLGLDPDTGGAHSLASLARGNLGGVALLDVLARTLDAGIPGGEGVAVAFGPGFTTTALRLRAVAGAADPAAAPAP
ncbi:PhlD [Streptomyces sp. NPDC006645]|uniref:PhlD n=1 Tax=unclassified Streptomyces TaxID=2593676 RepID=UPI0033A377CF